MSVENNPLFQIVHSDRYREDAEFRRTINKGIQECFLDETCDGIYGYVYGVPYCGKKPMELLEIEKSNTLYLGKNKQTGEIAIVQEWGWPGPDINVFNFKDYGITWGFLKDDVQKLTCEEWREYERNK